MAWLAVPRDCRKSHSVTCEASSSIPRLGYPQSRVRISETTHGGRWLRRLPYRSPRLDKRIRQLALQQWPLLDPLTKEIKDVGRYVPLKEHLGLSKRGFGAIIARPRGTYASFNSIIEQ